MVPVHSGKLVGVVPLYCGEGGENEDIEVWVVEISPAGPLNPKP